MSWYNNFFDEFGGRYVAEVLRQPLIEAEETFGRCVNDQSFWDEFDDICKNFIGRPTPLLFAENATKKLGGANLYIKLEGLANTGAHKINNAVGQALLAKRMGKKKIIAETGAGQHGVATASICAKLGLECRIYMGEVDICRQRPNVFQMELYGAEVIPVSSGSRTLKDAVNEALREWSASFTDTHYLFGSALGPSPFPDLVREFQSVIGREVKEECEQRNIEINTMVACVGGGSNAIGFFSPFINEEKPELVGVEAGGRGDKTGEHAARMTGQGISGIVQGYKSLFLLDEDGQVQLTHSVSAGLDYPGVGPQLAALGKSGRIKFTKAADNEAVEALKFFAVNEGVIFALESAHGGAEAIKLARKMPKGSNIIVNMSGRGDKDIFITAKEIDPENWIQFLKDEVENYEK